MRAGFAERDVGRIGVGLRVAHGPEQSLAAAFAGLCSLYVRGFPLRCGWLDVPEGVAS